MNAERERAFSMIGPENPRITAEEAFQILRDRLKQGGTDGRPVIVYDLDATLFDNRPRVIQILADALDLPEGKRLTEEVRAAVASVTPDRMRYLLNETLGDHGVHDPGIVAWFLERWKERFFTDDYVLYDHPTPGAVEFVQRLQKEGARTVYLTGRDTPGMRKGTLESLEKHVFPLPDGQVCYMITKPTFEQSDPDFKRDAIEIIHGLGTVIGVFDNEPKPMNVIVQAFPDAEHFFLDTMHSPDVEPLVPGIRVLRDFLI
ncbi:MAG: HAD family hydrolase [bacterium]